MHYNRGDEGQFRFWHFPPFLWTEMAFVTSEYSIKSLFWLEKWPRTQKQAEFGQKGDQFRWAGIDLGVSPMHICFAYGYMGIQFFQYHSYREKAVWNFFTSFYQLHFSLSLLPAPVSKLLIICKSVTLLFCSSWWTNMIYCITLSAIYIPILRSKSFQQSYFIMFQWFVAET